MLGMLPPIRLPPGPRCPPAPLSLVRLAAALRRPHWPSFLASFSCPDSLDAVQRGLCTEHRRQLNLAVPLDVAVNLTEAAIQHVRAAAASLGVRAAKRTAAPLVPPATAGQAGWWSGGGIIQLVLALALVVLVAAAAACVTPLAGSKLLRSYAALPSQTEADDSPEAQWAQLCQLKQLAGAAAAAAAGRHEQTQGSLPDP